MKVYYNKTYRKKVEAFMACRLYLGFMARRLY